MVAPRSPRYESLDIWRGFACLVVVLYHSVFYAQPEKPGDDAFGLMTFARLGWMGVPIFFVISGYCISATADNGRRKGVGIGDYFWRRFRRIFPPYWIFVLLAAVVVLVGDVLFEQVFGQVLFTDANNMIARPHWRTPWQWFGNLTLTESWRHHVIGDDKRFFIGPAWTLCYEEQFYLVTGMILLFARNRFFQAAALISVAVAVGCVLFEQNGIDPDGFFFDGSWLLFAFGILVYYCVNYGAAASRTIALLLFGGVAAWCTFAKPSLHELIGFDIVHDLVHNLHVASFFALALLLLHGVDKTMARASMLWPLKICGQMCYSLYLLHWPVVKALSHIFAMLGVTGHWATLFVVVPVCVAASVAVSWWYHRVIEARFLNTPIKQTA